MLEIGQDAPSFELANEKDEKITLGSLQGKKVVLYFYPKDDTPGCTTEGKEFTQLKNEFEGKNTIVLAFQKIQSTPTKSSVRNMTSQSLY